MKPLRMKRIKILKNSEWEPNGLVQHHQKMEFSGIIVFDDGAMFKHGNNGQGIYVDPKRDFCAIGFGVAANTSGTDYAPGFMRTAAKLLADN